MPELMDGPSRSLRRQALQKIGLFSSSGIAEQQNRDDLAKLCSVCPTTQAQRNGSIDSLQQKSSALAPVPMSHSELDVLLALCKAAPKVSDPKSAKRLLLQIRPYLEEVYNQPIAPSPFLRSIEPSPWESLTYHLTSAALAVGIRHPSLHDIAFQSTNKYLRNCRQAVSAGPASRNEHDVSACELPIRQKLAIAALTASLLGFLEAASAHADFYAVSERIDLVTSLRQILSEGFMVSIEGVFSSIRTADVSHKRYADWKLWTRRYAASGRPLGAMVLQHGFMEILVSCSSLQLAPKEQLQTTDVLDLVSQANGYANTEPDEAHKALLELLSDAAAEEMRLLEDGADYLQLGSAWQQRLAFTVKAHTLTTFLNCMIVDEDIADSDTLISWLEETMADPVQMADDTLARVVLRSMAVVAKFSPAIASSLSRSLPRFIVQGGIKGETVTVAARTLTFILQLLSQDAVITGLYSLGNVLSTGAEREKSVGVSGSLDGFMSPVSNGKSYGQHATGSTISLNLSGGEESAAAYGNVVRAIVSVASSCQDHKMTALAQSMLFQKLNKMNVAVDVHIITETVKFATSGAPSELKSLLKLYSKLSYDAAIKGNIVLLGAVRKARLYLSDSLAQDTSLAEAYLTHLLESIVSKGDVHASDNTHEADVELAAREIVELLAPLAALLSNIQAESYLTQDSNLRRLYRESWFNIVVHGITTKSPLGQQHANELRILAMHSPPLVAEDRVSDQFESEIELNTVLRRGMNQIHTAEQKMRLITLLPPRESDIRSLHYPQVVFLNAAYMVEVLRADADVCANVLPYFLDPSLNGSAMENCMISIANGVMGAYLSRIATVRQESTSSPHVASQLSLMLAGCCHRIQRVQQVAASFADRIIMQMPSSLCQKSSLFALLELLTIMWSSCLDGELDEYDWKSNYTSTRGNVSVNLPDNYAFRKSTLDAFYKRARLWVTNVINVAPLDIKGLLQTYLAEYDDDGAYGHVALGRSFAADMGAMIPATDQKLGAIDRHGVFKINTASDFIAQYTTRQEYKYAAALPDQGVHIVRHSAHENGTFAGNRTARATDEDEQTLSRLERRLLKTHNVDDEELRDILRRSAALLCRATDDRCGIIRHLVGVPFILFTKQSIKLGIALWLGVINENPNMEPRILVEIARNWENTVRRKAGVFSIDLSHLDPFYVKEEFAPSSKEDLVKRQQAVHDLIAPHLRILQFLNSHFHATRLSSPHLQRVFHHLVNATLQGMRHCTGHPLARELHFQILMLGLNILRYSTSLGLKERWKLKDGILSGGLWWFSHQPRWSFGGNRLQIKAEVQLIADVDAALRVVSHIGSKTEGNLQSLTARQELLRLLLENERTRLHTFSPTLVRAAWLEDPSIAIQLIARFSSPHILREVRALLLEFPEKAMEEPDALQYLIGPSLLSDVGPQLKYLLYWAPVNPITAVTYFMPAYGNHPFVLQYAMRALESHSVDITFFYVPQIVQSLRYDALGYVQRYVIETAKFSQLFAHQILWNMTANAYKDEDSGIEDPLKPKLDQVTKNMIASFSGSDKEFYEREFSFFNQITDISGKLRPYIKKSKPEKKQKIEEELRKIKVDVGVYLPSNPDGTVVGIDRKSGKPLQSHAKAPYMATFRVKKNRVNAEDGDRGLEEIDQSVIKGHSRQVSRESSWEIWQSAIFKVGDDCRQDILALQLVAAFRGIFNNVGLDVYVYPYRVTATAPGCGVIDVLPNSISRDMLGREAVNGLHDYFISKYGAETSIRFQEARNNFVKSMAAYSVISYLLQFKDRHNGNIMIDDAGHILHIDFGFCFDIAPGGIKFERAPFKLTSEMVSVMGGSTTSQSYRWFEELCIKSFLASRPHTEKLCHIVMLMLDSGLPCFKPETIAHLRQRFVLEKSEGEAADFMKDLIKKSHSNFSTKKYDQFQLLSNGIPY